MKNTHISKLTALLLASCTMISGVNAADLTASSTTPKISFEDTGTSTDGTIVLNGQSDESTWFNVYASGRSMIKGYITSDSDNSISISSDGNINFAEGSVFIDRSANRLGIGTTTPLSALHVAGDGDIRMTQGDETWELDHNNDWFNIVGPVNRVFTLNTKAPGDNFYMVANGNIGIGTNTPTAKLDVQGDIKATFEGAGTESVYKLLTLTANDTDGDGPSEAGFVLRNEKESKEWLFRTIDSGNAFTATLGGTGGAEFKVLSSTGNYRDTELYLGNGAKNVGGVWYNASSRALKENITPLSTEEALTAFNKLQPVTYNYKTDKTEKVVGFIAEDVPDLVAINSRDALSSMDIIALLTKVTQEQAKQLKLQAEKITKLESMQKRLAKVESLLTNLALDTSNTKTEKVSLNSK